MGASPLCLAIECSIVFRASHAFSTLLENARFASCAGLEAFCLTEHAPKIIAGGAVVGFLLGFGMPKILRRVVGIGLPIALVAMKIKQAREDAAPDYEI